MGAELSFACLKDLLSWSWSWNKAFPEKKLYNFKQFSVLPCLQIVITTVIPIFRMYFHATSEFNYLWFLNTKIWKLCKKEIHPESPSSSLNNLSVTSLINRPLLSSVTAQLSFSLLSTHPPQHVYLRAHWLSTMLTPPSQSDRSNPLTQTSDTLMWRTRCQADCQTADVSVPVSFTGIFPCTTFSWSNSYTRVKDFIICGHELCV